MITDMWPQGEVIKAWLNDRIVAVWVRMDNGDYKMVGDRKTVAQRGVDKLIVLENYE